MNGSKQALRRLSHGSISRRRLLTQASALGLAAAVAGGLAGREARATTPKSGGHLRLGTAEGSTSDVLDPAPDSSAFITMLSSTYLGQLTEVDANGELQPQLAESFAANDDATQWTFELRKGVTFHDGKPFVADDVVATLNHHRGEDSKSSLKAFAAQIEDVRADGDHRVILTLVEGNADYPFVLSTGAFSIVPSKDGKAQPTAGNGRGAYRLAEFEPGVCALLKKNPNHFNADRGHFDSAEITIVADAAARQNALISGEVDLIDKLELRTIHLLEATPGVVVMDVTGTLHYTFPMDTRLAPFDDVNVRLALKYAIDREEVLQKVLKGHGAAGNDHPISPATATSTASCRRGPTTRTRRATISSRPVSRACGSSSAPRMRSGTAPSTRSCSIANRRPRPASISWSTGCSTTAIGPTSG